MTRLLCLCLLAMAVRITTAHAEPRPYLQKPTVSFRSLPPVTDPHPLNPDVRYIGGYELTAHGTDQFTGLSDLQQPGFARNRTGGVALHRRARLPGPGGRAVDPFLLAPRLRH